MLADRTPLLIEKEKHGRIRSQSLVNRQQQRWGLLQWTQNGLPHSLALLLGRRGRAGLRLLPLRGWRARARPGAGQGARRCTVRTLLWSAGQRPGTRPGMIMAPALAQRLGPWSRQGAASGARIAAGPRTTPTLIRGRKGGKRGEKKKNITNEIPHIIYFGQTSTK